MFSLDVIRAFYQAKRIEKMRREEVLAHQRDLLTKTLVSAFDHSSFYREKWRQNGIRREDLPHISLAKIPRVTKQELMANFSRVVTDPGITKEEVERYIQNDPLGKNWFRKKYVALNTSGSSGVIGIFLYTQKFWSKLIGTVIARLLPFPLWYFPLGLVRVGFVGEVSGHHAGISLIKAAPKVLHAVSVDVSAPIEEIREMLEKHQPNVLAGYASGLAAVADLQKEEKIHIHPLAVISSGEALSEDREKNIQAAFGVRPVDFYGATECLAMGASMYMSGKLDIFDDLVCLESANETGSPIVDGQLGQVIITVLENTIFPIIRYEIDDEIALDRSVSNSPFTVAEEVSGRKMDCIVLCLKSGKILKVHPMDLVGLFFPGLLHYQVVQTGPRDIELRLVVEGDTKQAFENAEVLVDAFFKEKNISRDEVKLAIVFVKEILPNPKTGKTPIVVPLHSPNGEKQRASFNT